MRNEIAIALPSDKYDELVAKAKSFDNGDPNLPPCSSYFTKAMYRSIRTIFPLSLRPSGPQGSVRKVGKVEDPALLRSAVESE